MVGISISEHVITFLLTSLYLKFSANIVHLGMPTPSFLGAGGIGNRPTNLTSVTSNASLGTIGLSPLVVVCDYHND